MNIVDNIINEIKKDVFISEENKKTIVKNLKNFTHENYLSYTEGLNKLRRLKNKDKILEYIFFLQDKTESNDDIDKILIKIDNFKHKNVGIFSYYTNFLKENYDKNLIKALSVGTISAATLMTDSVGMYSMLIGMSLNIGVCSSKIANDSWSVSNHDLKMIEKRIIDSRIDDNRFIQKIIQSSKNIPDSVKKKQIKGQKEYLQDIINAFKSTDRHFKRILKNESFDTIIGIFENTQIELKTAGVHNISIKDYALLNKENKKENKEYNKFIANSLLKKLKSHSDFKKTITENVNNIDDNDIEDFKTCISKSINLIGLDAYKMIAESTKTEKFLRYVKDISGISISLNEHAEKFVTEFLDFEPNKKISEVVYNEIVEIPKEVFHSFTKHIEDAIVDLMPESKKIIEDFLTIVKSDNAQALLEAGEEIIPLSVDGILKKAFEVYLDDIEKQNYQNRKFSDKLKEEGFDENIIGKILIKTIDSITEVNSDLKQKILNISSPNLVNFAEQVKEKTLYALSTTLKVIKWTSTCLVNLIASEIPKGIGDLINYVKGTEKTIRNFDNDLTRQKRSITFNSVVSNKIKENNKFDPDVVLNNFKNFIDDKKQEIRRINGNDPRLT